MLQEGCQIVKIKKLSRIIPQKKVREQIETRKQEITKLTINSRFKKLVILFN